MPQQTLLSFFKKAEAPKKETAKVTETHKSVAAGSSSSRVATTESLAVHDSEATTAWPETMQVDDPDVDLEEGKSTDEILRKTRAKRRINYIQDDSGEDEDETFMTSPSDPDRYKRPRRRRLVRKIDSDDDDDDDYNPEKDIVPGDDEDMGLFDNEQEKTKTRSKASPGVHLTPLRQRFESISVKSPLSKPLDVSLTYTTRQEQQKQRSQKFKEKNEVRYSWLTDIRDANKNPIGSENYDPRTLYIPPSAWSSFTPFEKQFWEVKSKHWDAIVFFKKGKFYELYEKDADVGHKEFDLKMTDRVNMRMVGVPEMSFDYWAAQFIAKGYKVAKVDQMETAIGKSMREKNEVVKSDKVIRRELTAVLTVGTLVDGNLITDDLSTYCMSIKEKCSSDHVGPEFGICFVDTSTAEFNLVHFEDDINRTKLETLILQIKPKELVTEKGRLSPATIRILKNSCSNLLWNMLQPQDFWDERRTEDEIRIGGYFEDNDGSVWPEALELSRDKPLLMSAFGGLVSYLRELKLDKELLSAKNIRCYDPIRGANSLVLDGQTLTNLEIFQNSQDGSSEGTVFKLLNHCITPFGKRLFKRWLCHPLLHIKDINARLDAVDDFLRLTDIHESLTNELAKMPDLERLISRIHSKRCKVKEFLTTLDGFKRAKAVEQRLRSCRDDFKSALLKQIIDNFPNLNDELALFEDAFMIAEVDIDYQKMTTIIPKQGKNKEWDELLGRISEAERGFEEHLAVLKKQLKCSRITYKDLGKEIYQVEVPKEVKVPRDWIQLSSTSKVNRYWDSSLRRMVGKYKEYLETKNSFVKNFATLVYEDFDRHYKTWLSVTQRIAEVDALLCLAKASATIGEPACRPELLDQPDSALEFEELRHPCIVTGNAMDFIPNDTYLGGNHPNIIVLTGPNMGGKSTLLRQTCVAIIMAQLGCYVPARRCRLTPCDRIYTRIGANDNIMAGQSTFMVELQETSKILHEATPRSMVILDELGRGTSTFDGYAIAYAVLHYLATHVGCLAMFSTHYQTLCREFERNPMINNMHMGYYMDETENSVVFLYKLMSGICEKSFGMNVANMAGVPSSVIDKAAQVAEEFERQHRLKDTTYNRMIITDGRNSGDDTGKGHDKLISPAVVSDVSYLLAAALNEDSAEDIGDKASDMKTMQGREKRHVDVLRRILKGLSGVKV